EYVILPSRDRSPYSNRGLTKRQPRAESKIWPGWANARAGFSKTHGARDMDSTPPAITISASPVATMRDAVSMADIPEAHSRLTVMAGTDSSPPASSQAMRATLRFSSPAPLALPSSTSSTTAESSPLSSKTALMAVAAISSGRSELNTPLCRPTGVRFPETKNASATTWLLLVLQQCAGEVWFAFRLEGSETFGVVIRGTQLSLGKVFLLHRLPQTDALVSDRRDQFARCHKRTGRAFGHFGDAFAGEFQQFVLWHCAGKESLCYGVFTAHELCGVDQIQCAVGAEPFGEQRVATRVQGGTQVSKW